MKTKNNIPYNLFAKFFSGEISDKEQSKLDKFLSEDTKHEDIFNDYALIWNAESRTDKFLDKTDSALEKVKKGLLSDKKKISSKQYKLFFRIAAAIIIVVGISYFTQDQISNVEIDNLSLESNNKIVKKELADGSIVWLNKESKIEYPEKFSNNTRTVKLTGEAYFIVSHNSQKPFIVETEDTKTEVLGTEFNLKTTSDDNKIELILTKGRVKFTDKKTKGSKTLFVNEKVTLDKESRDLQKTMVKSDNYLSWKTNKINLNELTLKQIAIDLSNHFNKKISVEDEIKELVFHQTLAFKNAELKDILNTIKFSLNLSIDSIEGNIILKSEN